MFVLDTAFASPLNDIAVVAQIDHSASSNPAIYARSFRAPCQDVVSIRQGEEGLADDPKYYDPSRQIAFVYLVLQKLGYKDVGGTYVNMPAGVLEAIKTRVLQRPAHGKLTAKADFGYDYKPDPDYIGRDRFVFWVEVAGKGYRVIKDVAVVDGIDDKSAPACVTGKFILGETDYPLWPTVASHVALGGEAGSSGGCKFAVGLSLGHLATGILNIKGRTTNNP